MGGLRYLTVCRFRICNRGAEKSYRSCWSVLGQELGLTHLHLTAGEFEPRKDIVGYHVIDADTVSDAVHVPAVGEICINGRAVA